MKKLIISLLVLLTFTTSALAVPCRKCSFNSSGNPTPTYVMPIDTLYANSSGAQVLINGVAYTGLGQACGNYYLTSPNWGWGTNCRSGVGATQSVCTDGYVNVVDEDTQVTIKMCNEGTHDWIVPDRGSSCPAGTMNPGAPACDSDSLPDNLGPLTARFATISGCGAWGDGCSGNGICWWCWW